MQFVQSFSSLVTSSNQLWLRPAINWSQPVWTRVCTVQIFGGKTCGVADKGPLGRGTGTLKKPQGYPLKSMLFVVG